MFRVSQLFSVLETMSSNSSLTDSGVNILSNVSSLRSIVDNVRKISSSCKFSCVFVSFLYCISLSRFEKVALFAIVFKLVL